MTVLELLKYTAVSQSVNQAPRLEQQIGLGTVSGLKQLRTVEEVGKTVCP